ncbi:SlyX family protein [Hyphococcus luteus]|jgi:SlyX protein|uniref:Protein SlyX homolog n=1 Tax=Hyphococcus luteus TaxID=2058213 RepID=A0A2S7K0C6_9PROT|nr:SlyX family protein [Marinicaulis flavus]PQA85952.1 SlyX protein [Marinicaulis flavus]
MSDDALNARLEKLEERSAFQEQTIEDLSQAVTEQWKLLESFKREVSRLNDELKAVEDNFSRGGEREPPPPHY